MRNLSLTQVVRSGHNITAEHFGGNVVFSRNTTNGTPDSQNQLAHRELGISIARYPAGEPDVAYRDGLLVGGGLPEHLTNFLQAAQDNGQKVVIVTPTHSAYHGSADLANFTTILMSQYGHLIHAFEIGNEYWNHQTETSYGQIANDSVLAIAEGLKFTQEDVPIWVQMGDAGGIASEFKDRSDIGWLWRNIEANNSIIDQLSDMAQSEIDGVVEHYYFREQGQFILGDLNDQNIRLDLAIWEASFGRELSLNLTEWNIRSTNLNQLGMKAASTLIAQFSFMMEFEVDEAYVWPPMHNTSSDLAGGDVVILDKESGLIINSVGGAAFDLMSTSLVGLEYLPSATTEASSFVEQFVFSNSDSIVVYLASRSNSIETISFSLDQIWSEAILSSAIQIGYDQLSSDGLHYDYTLNEFVEPMSVIVNGETYYINEHDVRASVNVHDVSQISQSEAYSISLLPYEVIELVYEIPAQGETPSQSDATNIIENPLGQPPISPQQLIEPEVLFSIRADATVGDHHANSIATTFANNQIFGRGGDDSIDSGRGNDTIEGNGGNDFIQSEAGSDLVWGGNGFDTISGGSGHDTIFGGDLADSINGGWGNDVIVGGDGFDQITGGNGSDSIWGGSEPDRIYGGDQGDFLSAGSNFGLAVDGIWGEAGDDTIFGNAGYDHLDGGEGNDLIDGGHQADNLFGRDGEDTLLGGTGLDRLFGGNGDDQLFGGEGADGHFGQYGNDTMWGGVGNDKFFGGIGNDICDGDENDDTVYGGAGFDTIIGGSGDDLLFGNFNADIFVFGDGHGHDTISDFDVGSEFEKIDLTGFLGSLTSAEVLESAIQVAGNLVLSTGAGSSITLLDIDVSLLTTADFWDT